MKPFSAHHPAIGAGGSLLAGEDGSDAVFQFAHGFTLPLGVFVGIRQAPSLPWRMLPLFATAPAGGNEPFEKLTPGRYGRTFALASDRWLIGPLVFKLCTPWWTTSDPAVSDRDSARLHFAPSIGGFVEYDNTHSEEPVEVIVGMAAPHAGFQPATGAIAGFHSAGRFGYATASSADIQTRLGDSPFADGGAASGDSAALVFTIAAATKRVFPFAIGFFDTDRPADLHRSLFTGVEDVLKAALANHATVVRRADEIDAAWFSNPGTREDKIANALALRGHLAASRITKMGSRWKLARPADDGLDKFDAEVFPWATADSGMSNRDS